MGLVSGIIDPDDSLKPKALGGELGDIVFIDIDTEGELLEKEEGPVFLELRCCKGARKDLGRPKTKPYENKKFFQQHF